MLDDGVATSLHSPDAQAPTPIASAAIQVSETELGFPETPLDMRTTPTPTTPSDFAMLVHANEALQEEVDRVYTAAVEADRRGQEAREELARTTTEARERLNAEIAAREALIETAEHRAEEVRQLRHARDTERLKGEVSLGVQSEAYLRDVNVLETRVHDLACELAASRMFHAARFRTLRASVDAWSARLVTARRARFVRRHAAVFRVRWRVASALRCLSTWRRVATAARGVATPSLDAAARPVDDDARAAFMRVIEAFCARVSRERIHTCLAGWQKVVQSAHTRVLKAHALRGSRRRVHRAWLGWRFATG